MEVVNIKDFCSQNAVTQISNVRVNENGYPFLTFLSKAFEGGAQNIYFSRAQAAKVHVAQTPKELGIAEYKVVTTSNAAGEERLKLTTSEYANVEDLFAAEVAA